MRRSVLASLFIGSLSLSALSLPASVRTSGPMTPTPVRKSGQPMTKAVTGLVPDFTLPEKYRDRAQHPLPAKHSLAKASPHYTPYDPGIVGLWSEQGFSCAPAAAVNILFSHEANRERKFKPDPRSATPEYSYQFAFHFLNDGDMNKGDSWMSFATHDLLKEVGAPTVKDWGDGSLEWGNAFNGWMSGYDKYYRAMQVRLDEYYEIDARQPGAHDAIKQVLLDHADGSQYGAAVQTHIPFTIDRRRMEGPDGPRTSVYHGFSAGPGHSMSIVGWDDTYLTDLGGAWIMQDNQPTGLHYSPRDRWKTGTALDYPEVGIPMLFQRIKKGYSPKMTFKVELAHNQRGNIAVMTGVGPASGTAPIAWKDYAGAFNYAGGLNPMSGRGQANTLEFGLDMTDFAQYLTSPGQKLYLMVYSKGGTGTINKLSIMDYTGGTAKEIASTEAPKPIAPGSAASPALTTLAITWPGSIPVGTLQPAKPAPRGWRKAGATRVRLTDAAATQATLDLRDLRGRSVHPGRINLVPSSR